MTFDNIKRCEIIFRAIIFPFYERFVFDSKVQV